MKRLLVACTLLLLTAPVLNAQPKHLTLKDERGRDRVLLVFSNGNNQLAEAQLNVAAEHISDFKQRDLVLVGIQGSNPDVPTALLAPADDAPARKRFHVRPDQFTVILLGKDGGEKLRSHQPIEWEKLQSTIDAMPMRQDEMRGSKP